MMESTSDRSSSPPSDQGYDAGKLTVALRFIISSKEAGSIIGKKGDNIKRIREESGAKINISDASFTERIVSVTGSASQILKAFLMIVTKFEEEPPTGSQNGSGVAAAGQVILRLIVPNANCGSLIGKGGSNIKELRESSGATIQVANEMLPNSNERLVSISGSSDSISACIKRLFDIAAETKPKGPVLPYQPGGGNMFMQSGMYGARQSFGIQPMGMMPQRRPIGLKGGRNMPFSDMTSFYSTQQNLMANNYSALMRGGFQGAGGRGSGYRGRPLTKDLEVPNELVGTIIGRHGLKINEIRQVSGATIKISDVVEGSTTRRINITGSSECVDSAVYLINAIQAKYSKN
jgi:transcription antitermination factor NusA-like protein